MSRSILVLNAGSSTVKWARFDGDRRVAGATVESTDIDATVEAILESQTARFDAIGHRLVHGGDDFTAPVWIDAETFTNLERLEPLAPLHLPGAIAGIRAVQRLCPGVPQVACFDTAFHATLPLMERMFGIPRRYYRQGIRRYGFHGLSYESIAGQLPAVSPTAASGKTVVCHLGNGASLCGMRDRKSLTTTMGYTPLDGLLMSARPGRLDPGVVLQLMKIEGSLEIVECVLGHESGLLGVSGISSDMRILLSAKEPQAAEAVELFCSCVAKEIAAAATVLNGLDAIVFTAGIGEHSAPVRQRICDRLAWFGARLDSNANAKSERRLHAPDSTVEIYQLPTDEESVIARHTAALLGDAP
ncbi:MAG: acetate/propionate family kinase [Planctomycetia bacterium]|nr:acetate/propionate family kinase [Planctomycetia bacterium]